MKAAFSTLLTLSIFAAPALLFTGCAANTSTSTNAAPVDDSRDRRHARNFTGRRSIHVRAVGDLV
jgi:hypothetical protein